MKNLINMGVVAVFAAIAMSVFAAEMPLAEARARIGDAIADSKVMAETMKSLSSENQRSFLGEVNAAIAKMPGSNHSKSAVFLDVNRTALRNASKGNMKALIAEIFATVPVESLTVLNEVFAKDLFNRGLSGNDKITDAQFVQISKDALDAVGKRTSGMKDSDVRMGFALVMFVRASNGQPGNLTDDLLAILPEKSRDVAKSDWIPAALGDKQEKSYDPILGAADAGEQPDIDVVISSANPQILDALLAELVEGTDMVRTVLNPSGYSTPLIDDGNTIPPLPEPHGYADTTTGAKR